MSEKIKTLMLAGIFICLMILALKPAPTVTYFPPEVKGGSPSVQVPDTTGETVVQLGENRLAIVNTKNGQVKVLEFDGKNKTFTEVSNYNYNLTFETK